MRTTVDIPDPVFKKVKLKALDEGVAFKVVVTRALEREVGDSANDMTARKKRAQRLFAILDKARNKSPVGRLKRDELYDRPVLR